MTTDTLLGNNPTASETPDGQTKRQQRSHDRHVIRRATRKALQGMAQHKSLVDCGNPLPGEDHVNLERDTNGRVTVRKLVRCGSKQLCITCAGRLRAVDAMLIAWRVFCHFLQGGGVSMMTIAPRHHKGQALAPNKVCLIESFNAAWRTKAMRTVQAKYGIVGAARVFEITHGENKQLGKWATKTCQHPDAARAGVTYKPVTVNGRPTKRRKATFKALTNAEWYGLDPNQTRDADLAGNEPLGRVLEQIAPRRLVAGYT